MKKTSDASGNVQISAVDVNLNDAFPDLNLGDALPAPVFSPAALPDQTAAVKAMLVDSSQMRSPYHNQFFAAVDQAHSALVKSLPEPKETVYQPGPLGFVTTKPFHAADASGDVQISAVDVNLNVALPDLNLDDALPAPVFSSAALPDQTAALKAMPGDLCHNRSPYRGQVFAAVDKAHSDRANQRLFQYR